MPPHRVLAACRTRIKLIQTLRPCPNGRSPEHRHNARRQFHSSRLCSGDKPYYITTPIFYVNSSPHIGHVHSMILADVFKRWQGLKGKKAVLCTGTDEHGMKVQRAAARANIPPKEFCDINSGQFRALAQACDMDEHSFIRTTDPQHIAAVQHFWLQLEENGYIYQSKHEGWYCVSDECFYPESMVQRTFMPQTGKVVMASVETGSEVEWVEEKNYHFRMTALKERLLQFYAANPNWIVPEPRMKEVISWVENKLEDLSISRPVGRLEWGIPVPNDPSQTIYVWVDALINYITNAGYPQWREGTVGDGGWPADLHIIGKDILRFHGVYWPAMLLALDLPLPKRLLCHAHWTLEKKKISKSKGNAVSATLAMDRWGIDLLRYFLMVDGGVETDADYGNELISRRYKKDLQATFGNLLSRVTMPRAWSVPEAVQAACKDGQTGDCPLKLDQLSSVVSAEMERLYPRAALRIIMDSLVEANKYVSHAAPWKLGHTKTTEGMDPVKDIIFNAAEALRISSILLQPFMPTKAAEALDILGVSPTRRTLDYASKGKDDQYGHPRRALVRGEWESLFPPLPVSR